MERQTKAKLVVIAMVVLPLLVAELLGRDVYKKIIADNEWIQWVLIPYAIVTVVLIFHAFRGLTWARLHSPVWGKKETIPITKQTIPITYGPEEEAELRRRLAADRPRVEAAIEKRDVIFLYTLAVEYEENWYINEAIDLFRKVIEVEPYGAMAVEARGKLLDYGLPSQVLE